jgi:hypothetical protein
MPDKTPAEKMRCRPGMAVLVRHLPPAVEARLGLPAGTHVAASAGDAAFLVDHAATQAEAEARLADLAAELTAGAIAWIVYPKGAKAAGLDVSRDTIFTAAKAVGLTVVANVAVDETYSAVRVKRP